MASFRIPSGDISRHALIDIDVTAAAANHGRHGLIVTSAAKENKKKLYRNNYPNINPNYHKIHNLSFSLTKEYMCNSYTTITTNSKYNAFQQQLNFNNNNSIVDTTIYNVPVRSSLFGLLSLRAHIIISSVF